MATTYKDAIKEKCLDCCCDQYNEVKLCSVVNCPLYPFRLGKNPFSKRKGNPEALKKHRENTQGNV